MSSWEVRSYARATEPDLEELADDIRDHMVATGHQSFFLSWRTGLVFLEATSLSGVNDQTVQAAVTSAPAPSNRARVKRWIRQMPAEERCAFLTILDGINVIRAKLSPPLAAITPAQWLNAIEAKADETVPDLPAKT